MKKTIQYLSLVLMMALGLASCSGNSFKIDGNLTGFDGHAVRVVYSADSAIVDEVVEVDKHGKFSYKGEAASPAIVSLMDERGESLVLVVAVNGDHLKVEGEAAKAMGLKVKGNKLNEDWQLFRDEHRAFYTDPNPSRLDAAIAKYVKEHSGDMLSTVLLMADYSDFTDRDKVQALINSISLEARPESLLATFMGNPMGRKSVSVPRLMSLNLIKHGGDFEDVSLTNHVTLIHLWGGVQDNRQGTINLLNTLPDGVRVLDVLAESDTIRWHQVIAGDPAQWQHYWAPGGPMEQGIQLLGITSLPWFAVADSTGMVTYTGPDINAAIRSTSGR